MLIIKNATKSYDKKKFAIQNIDLTLSPGDLFGFVGHNGAGKTTLLKSIAGIINLDQGEITFNGVSNQTQPLLFKQQIAYIPDHPDLYETLTGREFIDFIANIFAIDLPEREKRIEAYAVKFEMIDKLNNPIATYSHGMKQKTALIAALVHQPQLLLLDEPFVGLDPQAAFQLKEIFQTLTKSGVIIFFSSHVLEVVEKITNKIAIIKQGKIIAQGETKTIIQSQSLESLFLELQ
jgi:ABC-2 type transport system ATP-binding protein